MPTTKHSTHSSAGDSAMRRCGRSANQSHDALRKDSKNVLGTYQDHTCNWQAHGIYSDDLNVLGLMPHPENFVDDLVGGTDGRGLFDSLVKAA